MWSQLNILDIFHLWCRCEIFPALAVDAESRRIPCRPRYAMPIVSWSHDWLTRMQRLLNLVLTRPAMKIQWQGPTAHSDNISEKRRISTNRIFWSGSTCGVQEDTQGGYNRMPLVWQLSRERASKAQAAVSSEKSVTRQSGSSKPSSSKICTRHPCCALPLVNFCDGNY